MFNKTFWKDVANRAGRTIAQALVAFLGVSGSGLLAMNWTVALTTAAGAGLVSVLTSLAGSTGPKADAPTPIVQVTSEAPKMTTADFAAQLATAKKTAK